MKKRYKKQVLRALLLIVCLAVAYVILDYQSRNQAPAALVQGAEESSAASVSASIPGVELPVLQEKRAEQVIAHVGYTVSYNADWHLPNWVAYELTAQETNGAQERTDKFLPDPLVDGDPVVTSDYKGSGYDRGHMAPAADMRWSDQAMKESFYMTNMCPQNHNNNAGDWKELEELGRDLAAQYGSLYIACGPIVGKHPETIGTARKIVVPDSFYKVFLRQSESGDWYSIGFVQQNKAQSKPLMSYMMSVNDIEAMTHIDFFPALPDDIEERVEEQFNPADWTLNKH